MTNPKKKPKDEWYGAFKKKKKSEPSREDVRSVCQLDDEKDEYHGV